MDVTLERFEYMSGERLEFPFDIQPGTDIVGFSGRYYFGMPGEVMAVETRSSAARKGLVCVGFHSEHRPRILLERNGELSFVMRNVSPNTYRIDKPFSPVQVTVTTRTDEFMCAYSGFGIFDEGRDITHEREVYILDTDARLYVLHLAPEMVFFRAAGEPIRLEEADGLAVRGRVEDLYRENPGFCLTITKEEVHTGGCPVYMLPFHYLDFNPRDINSIGTLEALFSRIFNDPKFMPVTGNAGLVNPGANGKVVCENITRGRDVEKYFKPHQPFALVAPIPFDDTDARRARYAGTHSKQSEIVL